MKISLHKNGKNCRKKCFPQDIKKLSNDILPTNTDLCVHVMYFNSSEIFKFSGWFRIGARMYIRPWARFWLNWALRTVSNLKSKTLVTRVKFIDAEINFKVFKYNRSNYKILNQNL